MSDDRTSAGSFGKGNGATGGLDVLTFSMVTPGVEQKQESGESLPGPAGLSGASCGGRLCAQHSVAGPCSWAVVLRNPQTPGQNTPTRSTSKTETARCITMMQLSQRNATCST